MLTTSKSRRTAEPDTKATVTRTPTTRKSLLDELASDPDSDRMDEFARIYEPVMRRYARQAQRRLRNAIGEADQDDLVQEAFIAVRRALPQFRYDRSRGRFRNYLSLTIRNIAFRLGRKAERLRPADPDAVASVAAGQNGVDAADDETSELMSSIWSIAYAQVMSRSGYTPNTKAIFRSHVLEGIPAADVAEEFKTTPNAVYQIKDRILRAVRSEIDSARVGNGGGLVDIHEELLRRAEASGDGGK